jgi:hypothetical protein
LRRKYQRHIENEWKMDMGKKREEDLKVKNRYSDDILIK